MPNYICCSGKLLDLGAPAESEADALSLPPVPVRPRARDRWQELEDLKVKPGWVPTQDFCRIFEIGVGNLVHGACRVNKRLREEDKDSWKSGKKGPPFKICRLSSLKQAYPRLK